MKKLLVLIFGAIISMSFNINNDADEIISALKAGNVSSFASYFDSFIDVTMLGKDEIKNMGKNQATIAIKSFFESESIKGFSVTSQRESGSTMYLAGKLQGANKTFNITILLKVKDKAHQIISIRIN